MTGYEYTPWIWPPVASAALNAVLSLYLWRRRGVAGARPLAVVILVAALWCLADAAQIAATEAATSVAWFLVADVLALPGVTAALWFALEYAGLGRWLTRPVVALLVAVPIVFLPLVAADGGRLVWERLWVDGMVRGELAPLGVAFAVYGFAVAGGATAIFLLLFLRSPAHRAPVALVLAGQVLVRATYALELLNIASLPTVTATVLALDVNSLMYTIALFRFRLFDPLPVARQAIFERMPDAVLVLDDRDRILDLNGAAERLLGVSTRAALRQPVAVALAHVPSLADAIAAAEPGPSEGEFPSDAGVGVCELRANVLTDWQRRPIGRLVFLHDITALRRVEGQLVQRERALAAAQERERMARELHDGLAQDLWLAKLKTGRLAALPELGSEARTLTAEVTAAVDAGLEEARHAVATMRLSSDGGRSLGELLARTLEDFEDRFGLEVAFERDPELPALPTRTEAESLRIVQEALTNVRRHADATVVRVRACSDNGRFLLEVRDNGRGFDPAAVGDGLYGVRGMRERAALVGGTLEIESASHRGTRVRFAVPVTAVAPVPVDDR